MTTIFQNEFVSVEQHEDHISWRDLKDNDNWYSGYTKAKRGLKNAIEVIKKMANDETVNKGIKMNTITYILEDLKMKPHTYCAMD